MGDKEMQGKAYFKLIAFLILSGTIILLMPLTGLAEDSQTAPAVEPEPELVIVKYGSLLIKSEPGTRVYVDGTYKGSANSVIESIVAADHMIECKTEDKSVVGTFSVRKHETLKLEADFDAGKLVLLKEAAKAPEPVAEKKKPEPVKSRKQAPEPKKVEQKNPAEERRKAHLNVMRIDYDISGTQQIKLEHAANQKVISKYTARKNSVGKYYRTKQGMLLCDAGPCELTWNISFIYSDETNQNDALLLKWKETVFNGITPDGTSKQDLECCLNGQCWKMQDKNKSDTGQEFEIGRYRLLWTKTSVTVRRSDIMKEILDAGRSLTDY